MVFPLSFQRLCVHAFTREEDVPLGIRELKQRRRRRQRERHLKIELRISAIISRSFKVILPAKCVLSTLKLNWNHRWRDEKTKLKICRQMITSSTRLHVVERTRTTAKCPKMKNARAKRAKLLFFIVKYANL